jgi:hypothetical protein
MSAFYAQTTYFTGEGVLSCPTSAPSFSCNLFCPFKLLKDVDAVGDEADKGQAGAAVAHVTTVLPFTVSYWRSAEVLPWTSRESSVRLESATLSWPSPVSKKVSLPSPPS